MIYYFNIVRISDFIVGIGAVQFDNAKVWGLFFGEYAFGLVGKVVDE